MDRKVGDYNWRQLSMWEFSPNNCIEKFVRSNCGKHTFHFYLKRITEIGSKDQWNVETVTDLEGVPEEILNWRNDDYRVRNRGE